MKKSRSRWYLAGYADGYDSANQTDWQDGEMEKAYNDDTVGEIANQVLEHWQQMAGTIYYEDVTDTQLDKWENGFFDGFQARVKEMMKGKE